jgi:hypothetical protein
MNILFFGDSICNGQGIALQRGGCRGCPPA